MPRNCYPSEPILYYEEKNGERCRKAEKNTGGFPKTACYNGCFLYRLKLAFKKKTKTAVKVSCYFTYILPTAESHYLFFSHFIKGV